MILIWGECYAPSAWILQVSPLHWFSTFSFVAIIGGQHWWAYVLASHLWNWILLFFLFSVCILLGEINIVVGVVVILASGYKYENSKLAVLFNKLLSTCDAEMTTSGCYRWRWHLVSVSLSSLYHIPLSVALCQWSSLLVLYLLTVISQPMGRSYFHSSTPTTLSLSQYIWDLCSLNDWQIQYFWNEK